MSFNPYSHQLFLFVANDEKGAMGQFMRDFGNTLEGFAGGEDIEMQGVSEDGKGPPDGWCFASWTTEAQAIAFFNHTELPDSTVVHTQAVGAPSKTYDEWLAMIGMQRLDEDE
jgi:hypothetical protein